MSDRIVTRMVNSIVARLRSLFRAMRHRPEIEADMDEEFRLHAELRARDLAREGMAPEKALRVARQQFGSPARYKEEARMSRGLHRINQLRFSWLDFRLGVRMLTRYPGITVVSTVAIAVAVALGTAYFEAVDKSCIHASTFPAATVSYRSSTGTGTVAAERDPCWISRPGARS